MQRSSVPLHHICTA